MIIKADFDFRVLEMLLPGELYHYTSGDGLLGILRSQELWATSAKYFTDSLEFAYGNGLLQEFLDEKKESQDSDEAAFVDNCRRNARYLEGAQPFIVSLTEEPDLLSQWRGYTRVGDGYSIGFNPEAILRRTPPGDDWDLWKCIYNREEQEELIGDAFKFYLEKAKKEWAEIEKDKEPSLPPGDGEVHTYTVKRTMAPGMEFAYRMVLLAAVFKHPSFGEEREWRLVRIVNPRSVIKDVRFRLGAHSLIPYTQFGLAPLHESLTSIVVGPTPEPKLAVDAVRLILHSMKLDPNCAWESQVPIRYL